MPPDEAMDEAKPEVLVLGDVGAEPVSCLTVAMPRSMGLVINMHAAEELEDSAEPTGDS